MLAKIMNEDGEHDYICEHQQQNGQIKVQRLLLAYEAFLDTKKIQNYRIFFYFYNTSMTVCYSFKFSFLVFSSSFLSNVQCIKIP